MIQEVLDNIGFISIIIKIYDKHKLKGAFADEIDQEVTALEDAYSDLLINFYLIFGATMIGTVVPPKSMETTTNKIVESYKNSLLKMENSLIQLGKTLKIHENDLYKLIGNNHSNRMIMENLLASINVDERTIDWEYLSHKNKIMHVDLKNMHNIDFPKKLNDTLKPFTDEFQINNVIWKDLSFKNVEKLWLNKDFRRSYFKLIKEYSD